MHPPTDPLGPHLRRYLARSAVAWAALVAGAFAILRLAQPAAARALPLTDADSIGLPLVAFALLAAGVLLLANAVAATALLLRRRGRASDAPAVPPPPTVR